MSHDEIMHMEIQAALDAMVEYKSLDKLMKSVDDSRLRSDFYKYCCPPVGFFDDDELNIARGVVRDMPELKQVCVCGQIFVRGAILYNIYRERLRNAREDMVVVVEADDDDDTRNATEYVVVVEHDDDDEARDARERHEKCGDVPETIGDVPAQQHMPKAPQTPPTPKHGRDARTTKTPQTPEHGSGAGTPKMPPTPHTPIHGKCSGTTKTPADARAWEWRRRHIRRDMGSAPALPRRCHRRPNMGSAPALPRRHERHMGGAPATPLTLSRLYVYCSGKTLGPASFA